MIHRKSIRAFFFGRVIFWIFFSFLLTGYRPKQNVEHQFDAADYQEKLMKSGSGVPVVWGSEDRVIQVLDATTVRTGKGKRYVLAGLEVPGPWKKEARQFLLRETDGREITIEEYQDGSTSAPMTPGGEPYAYLTRKDDRFFVNLEMIREGFAHTGKPLAEHYQSQFKEAEEDANAHHRGLWAEKINEI